MLMTCRSKQLFIRSIYWLAGWLAGVATQTAYANENEWPRFLGKNFDSISTESDWSVAWPTEGPTQLWKAKIGIGFSSFSVVGGKLYSMGRDQNDDTIICLDANTGKEIWRDQYPCQLVNNLHEGGPASTPTVAEGRVYTLSKQGHVFCLNAADGEVHWKLELESTADVKMPEWGFAGSILIDSNLAIIEAGRLTALDIQTGNVVWKTDKYRAGYGSPVPFEFQNRHCIATLNNQYLMVVDSKDGSEVAKTKWETSFSTNAATPLIDKDSLFISTGYKRGCALFRLEEDRLNQVYENKNMRNHMAYCVLYKGYLYGIDGNTTDGRRCALKCIDHKTGEVQWSEAGFGCGTVTIADDNLIILSDQGELVIAAADHEKYKFLAKSKVLDGKCWTVPVLSGGKIYCRNAVGDLVCIDVRISP